MPLRIIIKEDEQIQKTIIGTKPVYIGRSRSCDIRINDPIASGKHCHFRLVEGKVILTDLESTNGTFVNGQEIEKKTLLLQDVVTIGSTKITIDTSLSTSSEVLVANKPEYKTNTDLF